MTACTGTGEFCHKCGAELHAVPMDVGYVEFLCPVCELHMDPPSEQEESE